MEKQKLSNDRFNGKFLYFPCFSVPQEEDGNVRVFASYLDWTLLYTHSAELSQLFLEVKLEGSLLVIAGQHENARACMVSDLIGRERR
eukprot:254708-Amphidinium_carterae.1